MGEEIINVASVNAERGKLIRSQTGLDPFAETHVLLLSEVVSERDNLQENLKKAGFEDVFTDHTDLAIAVKPGYTVKSKKEIPLNNSNNRLKQYFSRSAGLKIFGTRNILLVTIETPTGEELEVATVHPVVPVRPFARGGQIRNLGQILSAYSENDRLVIGGDFNHFPSPRLVDKKVRQQARLTSVGLEGKDTYRNRFRGQLDDLLYRGHGIRVIKTRVDDVESDHRAIFTTFALEKRSTRHIEAPQRQMVHA